MEFEFLFILSILGLLNDGYCSPMCQGEYGPVCCNGYQWDETIGNCTKCKLGFTGLDCSHKCLYPHYGENCKWKCACDISVCDIAIGCVHGSKFMSTPKVEFASGKNGQLLQNQSLMSTIYTTRKPIQDEGLATKKSLPDDRFKENASKAKTNFFIWIVLSAVFVAMILLLVMIGRKFSIARQTIKSDDTEQKTCRELKYHRNTKEEGFLNEANMQEIRSECPDTSSVYEEVDEGTFVKENTTQKYMQEDQGSGAAISDYLTPTQIEKDSF